MRIPLIAGNWKMNKLASEAVSMVKELKELVKDVKDREILVCPPFTALSDVRKEIEGTNIGLGAQNLCYEEKGAFTGEISASMIGELCAYVIIGHSERRNIFKETNELVNKKIKAALRDGLKPIVCIGEKLEQREKGKTFDVVKEQFENSLKGLSKDEIKEITIAYEPVWAIGTGVNATPEQAEEVHVFIRDLLNKLFNNKDIRILYGGSVKPENIKELMAKENIDGALVGGASLDAKSFAEIVKF